MKALFISEKALKENSVINPNTNMDVIRPSIIIVQQRELMPLIGEALYDDLSTKILSGSLNTIELNFLNEQVELYMINAVQKELTTFLSFRFNNAGVQVGNTPNSQNATVEQQQVIITNCDKNMNFLAQRIIAFLIANETSFPAYRTETNIGQIHPKVNGIESTFFFPRFNRYRNRLYNDRYCN